MGREGRGRKDSGRRERGVRSKKNEEGEGRMREAEGAKRNLSEF
jgi:hypothetical protein